MNEKIIMNYEVVELLHKSSSWGNIVFKVKPQNKEKLYVLKCFPKIENGLQKLIFKREIEALRTLNVCEGIVKLRDSSTELYPFKENECYGGILKMCIRDSNQSLKGSKIGVVCTPLTDYQLTTIDYYTRL